MYLSQTELPTKKGPPVQETPFLQPAAEGFFLQYTLPEPICEPPNELQNLMARKLANILSFYDETSDIRETMLLSLEEYFTGESASWKNAVTDCILETIQLFMHIKELLTDPDSMKEYIKKRIRELLAPEPRRRKHDYLDLLLRSTQMFNQAINQHLGTGRRISGNAIGTHFRYHPPGKNILTNTEIISDRLIDEMFRDDISPELTSETVSKLVPNNNSSQCTDTLLPPAIFSAVCALALYLMMLQGELDTELDVSGLTAELSAVFASYTIELHTILAQVERHGILTSEQKYKIRSLWEAIRMLMIQQHCSQALNAEKIRQMFRVQPADIPPADDMIFLTDVCLNRLSIMDQMYQTAINILRANK